ncbi:MAG TPA: ABC transporter ATP-binding protein [Propionibacteriaceae bacterium]|nr:ABC transporter ATP-binding protein [Propionibacteriaceae bacterium]
MSTVLDRSRPTGPRTPGTRGHAVRVRDAGRRYGHLAALDGVSFDVTPGEFLVLLGPSGSGKSTLLRSLAGIERLSSGSLSLSGEVVDDERGMVPAERRDLAMVFQDYALWPHLTVGQNVAFALRRRGLDRDEQRRRVGLALEQVGLAHKGDRHPNELSGGEQQRVALARAVVGHPRLLLFDEPLSNLDAHLRERLRVEISTLTRAQHATSVYITHDQREAFALADRIGVLDHGRLTQLDTPEAIYHRPASAFVAWFTGISGGLRATATAAAAAGSEWVGVRLERGEVPARPMGAVRQGAEVRVLVRPGAATLTADADPRAHTVGTVTDIAYRGDGYDHIVEVPEGRLAAVHAQAAHPRGERVGVLLDPAGCHATAETRDLEPPSRAYDAGGTNPGSDPGKGLGA